jgi:excisionase family DNA binding protein
MDRPRIDPDAVRADRIARELAGQAQPRRPRQPTAAQAARAAAPVYLQTHEVAEILHVSPKTVARWAKDGKLPFQKTMGGHRRFPEAEIRALADELTVEAQA